MGEGTEGRLPKLNEFVSKMAQNLLGILSDGKILQNLPSPKSIGFFRAGAVTAYRDCLCIQGGLSDTF